MKPKINLWPLLPWVAAIGMWVGVALFTGCSTTQNNKWPYRGWETNATTVVIVTNIVSYPPVYILPNQCDTNGVIRPYDGHTTLDLIIPLEAQTLREMNRTNCFKLGI